ncbi:hypothetical protein [Thermomonospora echinospora]|uniref:hypothetical protein n=1 Tax=Thermomonospora echinospora TaxID=1992 RepID=UPI0011B0C596|nr:hypothetical protein [Thermomonospora echinospora]
MNAPVRGTTGIGRLGDRPDHVPAIGHRGAENSKTIADDYFRYFSASWIHAVGYKYPATTTSSSRG